MSSIPPLTGKSHSSSFPSFGPFLLQTTQQQQTIHRQRSTTASAAPQAHPRPCRGLHSSYWAGWAARARAHVGAQGRQPVGAHAHARAHTRSRLVSPRFICTKLVEQLLSVLFLSFSLPFLLIFSTPPAHDEGSPARSDHCPELLGCQRVPTCSPGYKRSTFVPRRTFTEIR